MYSCIHRSFHSPWIWCSFAIFHEFPEVDDVWCCENCQERLYFTVNKCTTHDFLQMFTNISTRWDSHQPIRKCVAVSERGGGKRVLRNCSFSGSNDGKPWYFGSTSFSDKPLWVFPKIGVFPKSSKSWMTVLALKTMVTWGIPPRINGHLNEKNGDQPFELVTGGAPVRNR